MNLHEYMPGLKRLRVEGSWDFAPDERLGADRLEADLVCFLLDKNGQTREDEDFVFYNNPQGAQLAVRLSGSASVDIGDDHDQSLLIDFEQLPYDVWSIALGVAVYQGVQRDQSFDMLRHGLLKFIDEVSGEEVCRIPFVAPGADMVAMKIVELSRSGSQWSLLETRDGYKGGLGKLAEQYGLQISSTS